MAIDINKLSNGVSLPKEVSNEILSKSQESSAVMRLAQEVALPGRGVTIPIITGDATASWVNETDEKPVSRPTMGSKNMTAYKLAVIVPFSKEFLRDADLLYSELVRRLPGALGRKFDRTVFVDGDAPGADFDVLTDAAAVSLADAYDGLVQADGLVSLGGGLVNGWALAPQGRGLLLSSRDTTGRPLFINSASEGAVPNLLGAPVYLTEAVYAADADGPGVGTAAQVGFAGDWTHAHYGTVAGIELSMSDQSTINDGGVQLNLWQRNMFAVRAEMEVGFIVRDKASFVSLTN